jgi:hypothetical protein
MTRPSGTAKATTTIVVTARQTLTRAHLTAAGPGRLQLHAHAPQGVFDLGDKSATLVSATPGTGWSMQVWKTESWIRVEFSSGADRVSVFCTWHDGPPRVEIGTY